VKSMTFSDCLKLVNELKSTVGLKEAFITRFAKKRALTARAVDLYILYVRVHE